MHNDSARHGTKGGVSAGVAAGRGGSASGSDVFIFQGRSPVGLLKLSVPPPPPSPLALSIRNMLCLVTRPAGWTTLFIDLGHSLSLSLGQKLLEALAAT